ncbi:MAG: C-type lectin domain-containing protein [Ruminococcus bromii]|nr:C-type lectin domain-containing protein [Ruminococcus bromii]
MKQILKCKKLFSVILCLCTVICISSCSAEKDNISATNQTEKSTTESVSEIEVYAGPGDDYVFLNKISKNNIIEYIKMENGWIEVEYNNKRGYIYKDNVNEIDLNKIPHVVYQVNQNVLPYPTVYNVKIQKSLFDDAEVYYAPKTSGTPTIINKYEEVTILCAEPSSLKNYIQIEFQTDKGKRRGYCESNDLLSLDNPLLNFEEVKQKNATITYNGNKYYSSSGEAGSLSNDWSEKDEKSIKKVDVNWIAGITGVIAGNDINEEAVKSTEGKIELEDIRKRKYINANTGDSKISNIFDIADFIVGSVSSFIESGVEITDLNVRMDEYSGEKRIVIKTGTPIEYSKAGKETDLSSLIVEKNNTALTLVESQKKADEIIKNMYPNLDKNKTYSMHMTFSDEFKDNNYGYYIVIDNKCNVYAVPIIHNGTSFKVFSEGKFICDAAWDISSSMIKIDDEGAEKILSILSENGFIVDGYEMKSDQEIVSESDTTSHPNDSIEYNGHHYKLFTQGMNWNEAKEYCQSFGGHLLTISSTEENKFIVDTFLINNDAGILLGFSDNEKEGKWIWVNDEEVVYTNWAENEPNNENNEDYALVYHDGTWNDGHLEKENWPFVCEWDY